MRKEICLGVKQVIGGDKDEDLGSDFSGKWSGNEWNGCDWNDGQVWDIFFVFFVFQLKLCQLCWKVNGRVKLYQYCGIENMIFCCK